MSPPIPIQVAVPPELTAAGAAILFDWKHGHIDPVYLHDLSGVALQIQAGADLAVELGKQTGPLEARPKLHLTTLGTRLEDADKLGAEYGTAYRAALAVIRDLYREGVRSAPPGTKPAPVVLSPATQLGALTDKAAIWIAGICATVVVAWLAQDGVVEVLKERAHLAAQVDQYIRDLQVRAAAGQPLPAPPEAVKASASSERMGTYALYGFLAVTALAAGYGVYSATLPRRASNPRRRRIGRARARRAVRALPAPRRRNPAKRRKPRTTTTKITTTRTTSSNPIASGYSKETVRANIAKGVREGKPGPQAAAIALGSARHSYRRKHKRGAFPKHLETPAERKGHKKAAHKPKHKKKNPPAKRKPAKRPKVKARTKKAKKASRKKR